MYVPRYCIRETAGGTLEDQVPDLPSYHIPASASEAIYPSYLFVRPGRTGPYGVLYHIVANKHPRILDDTRTRYGASSHGRYNGSLEV